MDSSGWAVVTRPSVRPLCNEADVGSTPPPNKRKRFKQDVPTICPQRVADDLMAMASVQAGGLRSRKGLGLTAAGFTVDPWRWPDEISGSVKDELIWFLWMWPMSTKGVANEYGTAVVACQLENVLNRDHIPFPSSSFSRDLPIWEVMTSEYISTLGAQ